MRRENLKTCCAAIFIFFTCIQHINGQPTITYVPFITGLSEPIEVVTAPGDVSGRLFIVQKGGSIRIWNGTSMLATPFLTITDISTSGEQGLLSMAFHPAYQSNGYFFVYHINGAGDIVVARYQVSADPNVAISTGSPMIVIPHPGQNNHNGAHLQFKTESGVHYLYFATGDGGGGNDPNNNAQNPASLLGKLIRIDVDAASPAAEIWAWGLRNPFRWSFDRFNGDLWIGDVGQNQREEISYLAGGVYGANFGWVCMEADIINTGAPPGISCDTVYPIDVVPIFAYPNPASGSSSVIGGYVYRGTEFPSLYGWYMAADFYSGQLWVIRPDGGGGWQIGTQTGMPAGIASFSETNDGSTIYAPSLFTGTVYRIEGPIVTPLSLLRFSGTAGSGYNDLAWTAESEEDIDQYEIEFSMDGNNYSPAGSISSLNDGNRNHYSFRHFTPINSDIFYRLKVREFSGHHFYSPVISIRSRGGKVSVHPSLVSDSRIQVHASVPIEEMTLFNSTGVQLLTRKLSGQSGYFTIDVANLPGGVYYLRFNSKTNTWSEKIIIK